MKNQIWAYTGMGRGWSWRKKIHIRFFYKIYEEKFLCIERGFAKGDLPMNKPYPLGKTRVDSSGSANGDTSEWTGRYTGKW